MHCIVLQCALYTGRKMETVIAYIITDTNTGVVAPQHNLVSFCCFVDSIPHHGWEGSSVYGVCFPMRRFPGSYIEQRLMGALVLFEQCNVLCLAYSSPVYLYLELLPTSRAMDVYRDAVLSCIVYWARSNDEESAKTSYLNTRNSHLRQNYCVDNLRQTTRSLLLKAGLCGGSQEMHANAL